MINILSKNQRSAKLTITPAKRGRSAFTLLETVTVLFIISVGLIGVLSLTIKSANVQNENKNLFIASQLAQEGLELVRNVRDTNWILSTSSAPIAWDRYIEGNASGQRYRIDYVNFIPTSVNDISEARLQRQSTGSEAGFFLHDSGQPDSIFSRLITITSSTSTAETVSSLVVWEENGKVSTYKLETMLYDWK